MATDDKNKKPLVLTDAANEETNWRDYAKPDENQVGTGWAGAPTTQPVQQPQQELKDNTPTIPYSKVREEEVTGKPATGVPGTDKVEAKPSATNYGVLAGAPSQVVIQHMLDQLPPMETKEQREKRERRERINKTMAAIGDGFSSLANIYYATKGAPAAEGKTLSEGETARVDKEKKERETAVDRRIRLLKEQRTDMDRLQRMKLQQELNEARKEYYRDRGKAGLMNAEGNVAAKTITANAYKSSKEAETTREDDLAKKKGKYYEDKGQEALDKGKAAKTTAGAAATKAATDREYKGTLAKNSTAKTNAYVSDKEDQKKKRKDNSKKQLRKNRQGL